MSGSSDAGVCFDAVSMRYPGGAVGLADANMAIEEGTVTLVIGGSASGKSTFLRCVNGLVPHATGGEFAGDVRTFGRSVRSARPRDFADVVGFVHQDPEAQFVLDRVEADVAFVLENLGLDAAAMRRRVEEALDALGVAHLRDRHPATLSGGERQRCAIAGVLAAAPAALVLDEPTSQLDPQGADDVLAAVARLNADLGTTVLLAEHRLERAAPLADAVIELRSARVSAPRPPASVAGYEGAPEVTKLGLLLGWEPPPLTVREARMRARGLSLAPGPQERARAAGAVVLSATSLRLELGGRMVLDGIDLDVQEGEIVVLLGRNGAGKTTLLRALAGLLAPARGTIDRHLPIGYVPQDPSSLLYGDSVRAELEETLRLRKRRDSGAVEEALARFGLIPLAARHPRSLSGGERQRAALAAVAVGTPGILLLDEPTRGIDAATRQRLEVALRDHAATGGAVLLATHDVELAARVASRAVVLGDGDVVADGPARAVLSGSLYAPQIARVLPGFLTLDEVAEAWKA